MSSGCTQGPEEGGAATKLHEVATNHFSLLPQIAEEIVAFRLSPVFRVPSAHQRLRLCGHCAPVWQPTRPDPVQTMGYGKGSSTVVAKDKDAAAAAVKVAAAGRHLVSPSSSLAVSGGSGRLLWHRRPPTSTVHPPPAGARASTASSVWHVFRLIGTVAFLGAPRVCRLVWRVNGFWEGYSFLFWPQRLHHTGFATVLCHRPAPSSAPFLHPPPPTTSHPVTLE